MGVILVPPGFDRRWVGQRASRLARRHGVEMREVVAGDRLFATASYGTGAVALRWNGQEFEEMWSGEDSLTAHYATPVFHEGTLFGFDGRQEYGQSLRALDASSGKVLWSEERFGAGTVLLVGDRLLILKESGELVVAPASRAAFRVAASAQILSGVVRAYPAFANGRLYARDEQTLVCLDLNGE